MRRVGLFTLVCAISICAGFALKYVCVKTEQAYVEESLEALAGSEGCITRPHENKGTCRDNVGGGFSCVESYWYEKHDCYSD